MASHRLPLSPQHGAVLLMALCVVMVLMLLGLSSVRYAANAEKSARGERDRQVALQAAEAALEDAGRDIEGGRQPGGTRAQLFAAGSSEGFLPGCGAGRDNPALGLCARNPVLPAWQSAALAGEGVAVEYGQFTGALMPHGSGALPARLPRYIIELMPYARAGQDAGVRSTNVYRITAIGFGASERHCVVLQALYLKAGERT